MGTLWQLQIHQLVQCPVPGTKISHQNKKQHKNKKERQQCFWAKIKIIHTSITTSAPPSLSAASSSSSDPVPSSPMLVLFFFSLSSIISMATTSPDGHSQTSHVAALGNARWVVSMIYEHGNWMLRKRDAKLRTALTRNCKCLSTCLTSRGSKRLNTKAEKKRKSIVYAVLEKKERKHTWHSSVDINQPKYFNHLSSTFRINISTQPRSTAYV